MHKLVSARALSPGAGKALVLGVDVGGTAVKAGIVGTDGELVSSFHGPSPRTRTALHDFVHSILGSIKHSVRGIGVGCKGIINPETTRVECLPGDLHFLEGQYLSEVIAQADLPVCADNDARTALIGEVLWGAARGRRNVVMLTLGTGVGGAVLVNGTILRGTAGVAGHLGHVTVDARGELCICGNYGCLETVFSSRAIESAYWAHLHRAVPATLCADDAGRPPDTEAIFRAAAAGDECARYVVDRAHEHLTAALVTFLHTFDPEILILGGNIAAAGPSLLGAIQDKVARRTKTLLRREVPIVLQKSIGYGGVLGAAGLVFLQQNLLAI